MDRPSNDELISAYFDDETTPEESVVVERLLADPKHRQALEEYRNLREELRALPAPKLDTDWSARLKQRLVTAQPDWAGKPDGATKAPVLPDAETPPSGVAGGPRPASLDRSRGDGYSRYRHLWLTAGVGVAAGTLGIVIGWSAQVLSPADVAYDVGQAAAPVTTSSPAARSSAVFATDATTLEMYADEAPSAGAEGEFATDERASDKERSEADDSYGAVPSFASPPRGDAEALPDFASRGSGGVGGEPRFSRSGSVPPIPGPPLTTSGVSDAESLRQKKSEKQGEAASGMAPDVRLEIDSPADRTEDETLAREGSLEADSARFATYVGVWDSTSDRLSTDQVRGVMRQMSAFADRPGLQADGAEWHAMDGSFAAESAPALVLEGSPEHVAEALEVLSRDRSRGLVRLVERVDDASSRSYYERSRRLNEVESRMQRKLVTGEEQPPRRSEDRKDDAARDDRSAAGDALPEALALGVGASPIDRIEAFFFDDGMARGSLAEGAPSNGMLAGSFGSGGGMGGLGGGFGGGIGGEASPYGSAPSGMPSVRGPSAEAPQAAAIQADASQAGQLAPGEPSSEAASNGALPATMPAAGPAPATDLARARGGAALAEGAAAPLSGPIGAESESAGVAPPAPRPAAPMAGRPDPPAPSLSPALADESTPPPPAEVASAPLDSAAADPSIANASGAVGKANRMEELAEQAFAKENLQMGTDFAASEDRPMQEGKFAPAPQRVRVILFAAERPLTRSSATPEIEAVPAGAAPAP